MHSFKNMRKWNVPELARQLLIAWFFAVTVEFLLLPEGLRDLASLTGLAQMSPVRMALLFAGALAVLVGLSRFLDTDTAQRWVLVGIFAVLMLNGLKVSHTQAFLLVCGLVAAGLVAFGFYGWEKTPEPVPMPKKVHFLFPVFTVGLSLAFFFVICVWTVCRVESFCAPTYDFGIFSQMFYYMKESGLPLTTLERDGLLSHFHVHMSPIYYLMLPFYCLVPTPATLQVLQAAVMTSAVIPLWLIGKHRGLSGLQRMLLCAVLLLYPAFAGGVGYDIHENCFLTPLLLWLLYGIDRKKPVITAIAALLTLTVKEDAAVYVGIIALYLIVRTVLRFRKENWKELVTGFGLLAVSLVWFFLVTDYLARQGDGVMTYRYDNFIFDGSASLVTVIRAVLRNPLKVLYECVDPDKLEFISITLIPLLGLPFLTRRYERYILLIPYVLVNLMPDYQYQHNIFFQYTFGSTACLIYLSAVNLAELKIDRQRTCALAGSALIGLACFCAVIVPEAEMYATYCIQYETYYETVRNTLDTIPEGASVSAPTFYTAYLSQRKVLYDIRYASREHVLETEFVVLQTNSPGDYENYNTAGKENGYDNLVELLKMKGYEIYAEYPGILTVYRKASQ